MAYMKPLLLMHSLRTVKLSLLKASMRSLYEIARLLFMSANTGGGYNLENFNLIIANEMHTKCLCV